MLPFGFMNDGSLQEKDKDEFMHGDTLLTHSEWDDNDTHGLW